MAPDQRERIPTSKAVLRDMLLKAATRRAGASAGESKGAAGEQAIERKRGRLRGSIRFHVARSTLNEWHRRAAVIGLLRGERKHVYPLDQFVDARPTRGIGDVAKIAPR
jgi:hypothetical protein